MDWRPLVRDELKALTGDAAHDAEIVEELAEDLAQRFEERHANASTEREVRDYLRAELGDGERLAARLRRARPARLRPPAPPAAVARPRRLAGVGQDVR